MTGHERRAWITSPGAALTTEGDGPMTQQTANTLDIGITRTTDSNSLFEDATGADIEASMALFDELMLAAVAERFPDAIVALADRGYIWDVTVDSQMVNGNDTEAACEAQLAIQAIADEIHQDGAWIVETA